MLTKISFKKGEPGVSLEEGTDVNQKINICK